MVFVALGFIFLCPSYPFLLQVFLPFFSTGSSWRKLITDFTQGVERGIECWCYGQHQPLTNPCYRSLLDCLDLSQYKNQLFVSCCALLVCLSRFVESPASFELPLVQTALGTLCFSNDSRGRLSPA